MTQLSRELRRRVGLLVDRKGTVTHVVVGDHQRVWLPDLGRVRAGAGRFRGVRYLRTHLGPGKIDSEDLTDLARLRLDLVAAIGASDSGYPDRIQWAHLLPRNPEERYCEVGEIPPGGWFDLDFPDWIVQLETEFGRKAEAGQRTGGTRAFLVVATEKGERPTADVEDEMRELCHTAGVDIVQTTSSRRRSVHPKTVIGPGRLDQLQQASLQEDVDMLVFSRELRPGQLRAIAEATSLKVVDRTQLILDIFARRAKSRGGKLQVELAQLRYALPRLGKRDDALSRLAGGIGGRGPGETKLEVEGRRARDRIRRLEKQLDRLGASRDTRRKARRRARLPIVAVVGYTNAGKSTLLNALTGSDVLAEDKAFATLDPTTRRLRFPEERELILADTVGFIHDLPPELLRAFASTLEEMGDADLLLHVVDISAPDYEDRIEVVERLLDDELGLTRTPRLMAFNKADRLPDEVLANHLERWNDEARFEGRSEALAISAIAPASLRPLVEAIEAQVWPDGDPFAYDSTGSQPAVSSVNLDRDRAEQRGADAACAPRAEPQDRESAA